MNKYLVVALAFALVTTLSNCGKQAKEDPVDEADSLISEIEGLPSTTTDIAAQPAAGAGTAVQDIAAPAAVTVDPLAAESEVYEKPTTQAIQEALKNAGLYNGSIDGVLGPKTKRAIREFQSINNLAADGKVGRKTWSKLKPYLAGVPASPALEGAAGVASNAVSE